MKHSKSTYASVDSATSYFADKTNQTLPLKNFTKFLAWVYTEAVIS